MELLAYVATVIVGSALLVATGYLVGLAVTREAVFGSVGPDEGLSSDSWEYNGRVFWVITCEQLAETANEVAKWKGYAANWEQTCRDQRRYIVQQQQTIDDLTVELEAARKAIRSRESDIAWLKSAISHAKHQAQDCRNQLTDLQNLARALGDDLDKLAR